MDMERSMNQASSQLEEELELNNALNNQKLKQERIEERKKKLKIDTIALISKKNMQWKDRVSNIKSREFVINQDDHRGINLSSIPKYMQKRD